MPPKVAGAADTLSDPAVTILINLIRTATEFQVDNKAFAELSGIKDAKNAPRKYNVVLERHGLKIAGGKVITTDGNRDGNNNQIEEKEPKTPGSTAKITSKTPNSKPPKTPASKKRKMKVEKEEEEEPKTPMMKTPLSELDKEILREKSEDEAD